MEKEHWQGDNGTVQPSETKPPAQQEGKRNKLAGQQTAKAELNFVVPMPVFFHLFFLFHMSHNRCKEEEGVGGEMGIKEKLRQK